MALPVHPHRIGIRKKSEVNNQVNDSNAQSLAPLPSGFSVSYANQTVAGTTSVSLSRSSMPTYNCDDTSPATGHDDIRVTTTTPDSAARLRTEHRSFSATNAAASGVLTTSMDNTPFSRRLVHYSQDPSPMPLKPRRTNHAAAMTQQQFGKMDDGEVVHDASYTHSRGTPSYHRNIHTTLQESLLQSASQPGSRPRSSVSTTSEAAAPGRINTHCSASHVTIAGRPPMRLAGVQGTGTLSVGNPPNEQHTETTTPSSYCDPMANNFGQVDEGKNKINRDSIDTYSLARPGTTSTATKTSNSRSPLLETTPDSMFRDSKESSATRSSGKKQPRDRRSYKYRPKPLQSPRQSPSIEAVGGLMGQLMVDRGGSNDSSMYARPRFSCVSGNMEATYETTVLYSNDSLIAPTRCLSRRPESALGVSPDIQRRQCLEQENFRNDVHIARVLHSEDSDVMSSGSEEDGSDVKIREESTVAVSCEESEEDNFQPDSENEDDHYSEGRRNNRMRHDSLTYSTAESPSIRQYSFGDHSGYPKTSHSHKPFISHGCVGHTTSQNHNHVPNGSNMRHNSHASSIMPHRKELSLLPTHLSMNPALNAHMSLTSSSSVGSNVPNQQGDSSYIYTPLFGNATPNLSVHHGLGGSQSYSLRSASCPYQHPISSQPIVYSSSPGMVSPVSQCSFLKRNDSMQFSCGYGCSTPMIGIMPQNGNDHSAVTLNAHNQDEISVFKANKLMMEFREIGHLGQGNFGKALLVEENATGHYFVIKVSAPMMSSREEQRLKQERNILFAIRGTPHCATLYDSWAEGTSNSNRHLYLKMHWYERGSVTNAAIERRNIKTAMLREYEKKKTGQKREILKNMAMEYGENVNEVSEEELLLKAVTQKTSWSEKEVLIFVGQMAIALDAIHSVNIVHVDFKPDNVFIDASGNYFLGDFGCALTLDEKTQKPLSVGNNFLMTSSQNGKFSGLGSAFDRANMTSSDTADDAQFPLMTPPLHGVNPRNSSINQTLDGFPNMPVHMKPSNLSMLPSGCGTEERRESMNNVTGTSLFDTLRTSTGNSNSGPSVSQSLASQDEGDCRYVALDMINKKDNYKAGDIFSFGMSLYELMVGEEPPRNGQKFEQMRKRTDLNELLERGYSPELVALVLPMLNPDPYMRPTAREILRSPLLQPTADTLVALSNVGHIIDTCLPSVLPAKYMKSFLPSTVPVGSPSFSPTSTQMMSNCLNGNTANNGSSTSFFPAATPTNSSPDWLDTTAIGQSDIALKNHSTDRCLMRSPITSLVQGSTNITNDESFISPVQLSADQQSLVPDQSVASEITLLSPLNACDDTIEPFYTTPLHEKSASPIVSGVKQTPTRLHNRVLSDSQPMSRPPNELLSEAGQLELRYHKTCMEIAHYTMELLNRATSGVIPPARARFVKWVQEKEFRKVRLKSGNRVGSAKGHTPSVGKPPRPSPKPMRGKGNHNKYKSESQIESVGCTPMQQASVHMSNTSLTTPPTTTTKDERCLSAFQTPNAHIKSRRSR